MIDKIWAQGARAGDPLFFSSLYTKTCTRTRSAETADATYGRLPRSRAGRRRAQACGAHAQPAAPASVRGSSLCGLRTRTRRGGDDCEARRVETRWRGAARGDNRAIVASPNYSRTPSTSPCHAPTLPCYRARRGGVGDAGGIEPACTDAPDGARPRGERKDALDTVALRRCRAQVASIAAAAVASVGVKPKAEAPHSAPVAPRGALRRRLCRRTCTARARAQRHRSVLRGHELARLRVRAQLLRSARVKARGERGGQVDGKWRDGWRQRRPPTRLEPAAAGRRTRVRACGAQKKGRTHARIKGGPSQYPERLLRSPFSGSPGYLSFCMRIAVLLLAVSTGSATLLLQRRALATVVAAIVANKGSPQPLMAIEAVPVLLTDQEMAARVARKMELLRQQSAGTRPTASSGSVYEANIRSDFNPDAAVSLRSRSFVENAKASLSKQQELKTRDKKQKRDDMCEMLGRGC